MANTITDKLRSKALEMGLSHVGVARAEPLERESALLDEWLRKGYHAGMQYMERNFDKRRDPGELVPGAESVIVVTHNYYSPEEHPQAPNAAKVSRYAWGTDYHDVFTPKVRELESYLKEIAPGTESRSYVDTGPVMEKAWAVSAGIGWLGKHTNLITKDLGSWVFLGVIITTAKLEYDTPISDFCGDCTACIEACPTDAIPAPYQLDSNKCIPYLTIEHRGEELPGSEDMDFENWVFGCDICQDVCPWNRFAQETKEQAYHPREEVLALTLEEASEMNIDRFRQLFRKSPVKRTKLDGLKRNARIVLSQNESHKD
ncbi:MAG: tRNA epoxyqueuosine(34) reductase QueG [Ectothiorhodospiraceae bacterium]|nr:tRNA epoxyqueuosine(34) reductase QueG [Ectothiorhodospiraceae bacterium]